MPIGAITMILTNVGLQIYNNWCGSRQNKQLQQKREEFERAAKERNTQRMWQLMREGQELTRQLEEEKHQQRLEELKNDIGSLLQKLAYVATINNWPLNVLPIVMKNQALGNLLANQEEGIALHCIFTPSNSVEFNRTVFPRIEEALETYCNQHWSVMSEHPILFYSGAWKSQQAPTEVQIDSMRTALSNLPTLVITPFFRPNDGKLVFHVRIWGVGASSSDEFSIPEIEPTDFQRNYQTGGDYVNDTELMDELIEDLVPYLECMIGFMADTYFWSSLGKAPHLPLLVTNGTINTDGMKYLVDDSREYYDKLLLTSEENAEENPFIQENLLNLYEGSSELWDEDTKKGKLERAFLAYVNSRSSQSVLDLKDALNPRLFSKRDIPFIDTCLSQFSDSKYETELLSIKKVLDAVNFDYGLLESTDIDVLKKECEKGNAVASFRLGEIYEYSIGVKKWDESLSNKYYQVALTSGFLLAKLLQDIYSYEQYINEIECLINSCVSQSIAAKAEWLCSQKRTDEALDLVSNTHLYHPAILFKKAKLLIDVDGDASLIENTLVLLAENGYVKAQELLCELYQKGEVLPESPINHAKYAEKAMLQNSPYATYAMALCYLNGYGVQQSTSVGIMLIDKAIDLGWPEAQRIKSLLNSI